MDFLGRPTETGGGGGDGLGDAGSVIDGNLILSGSVQTETVKVLHAAQGTVLDLIYQGLTNEVLDLSTIQGAFTYLSFVGQDAFFSGFAQASSLKVTGTTPASDITTIDTTLIGAQTVDLKTVKDVTDTITFPGGNSISVSGSITSQNVKIDSSSAQTSVVLPPYELFYDGFLSIANSAFISYLPTSHSGLVTSVTVRNNNLTTHHIKVFTCTKFGSSVYINLSSPPVLVQPSPTRITVPIDATKVNKGEYLGIVFLTTVTIFNKSSPTNEWFFASGAIVNGSWNNVIPFLSPDVQFTIEEEATQLGTLVHDSMLNEDVNIVDIRNQTSVNTITSEKNRTDLKNVTDHLVINGSNSSIDGILQVNQLDVRGASGTDITSLDTTLTGAQTVDLKTVKDVADTITFAGGNSISVTGSLTGQDLKVTGATPASDITTIDTTLTGAQTVDLKTVKDVADTITFPGGNSISVTGSVTGQDIKVTGATPASDITTIDTTLTGAQSVDLKTVKDVADTITFPGGNSISVTGSVTGQDIKVTGANPASDITTLDTTLTGTQSIDLKDVKNLTDTITTTGGNSISVTDSVQGKLMKVDSSSTTASDNTPPLESNYSTSADIDSEIIYISPFASPHSGIVQTVRIHNFNTPYPVLKVAVLIKHDSEYYVKSIGSSLTAPAQDAFQDVTVVGVTVNKGEYLGVVLSSGKVKIDTSPVNSWNVIQATITAGNWFQSTAYSFAPQVQFEIVEGTTQLATVSHTSLQDELVNIVDVRNQTNQNKVLVERNKDLIDVVNTAIGGDVTANTTFRVNSEAIYNLTGATVNMPTQKLKITTGGTTIERTVPAVPNTPDLSDVNTISGHSTYIIAEHAAYNGTVDSCFVDIFGGYTGNAYVMKFSKSGDDFTPLNTLGTPVPLTSIGETLVFTENFAAGGYSISGATVNAGEVTFGSSSSTGGYVHWSSTTVGSPSEIFKNTYGTHPVDMKLKFKITVDDDNNNDYVRFHLFENTPTTDTDGIAVEIYKFSGETYYSIIIGNSPPDDPNYTQAATNGAFPTSMRIDNGTETQVEIKIERDVFYAASQYRYKATFTVHGVSESIISNESLLGSTDLVANNKWEIWVAGFSQSKIKNVEFYHLGAFPETKTLDFSAENLTISTGEYLGLHTIPALPSVLTTPSQTPTFYYGTPGDINVVHTYTASVDGLDMKFTYQEGTLPATMTLTSSASGVDEDFDLYAQKQQISTNTSNINTNTTDISTNTSNISTNTSNIITNTSNISTNTGNINTNTTDISTNSGLISTNTGNILTNTNYRTLSQSIFTLDQSSSEFRIPSSKKVIQNQSVDQLFAWPPFDTDFKFESLEGATTHQHWVYDAPITAVANVEVLHSIKFGKEWGADENGVVENLKVGLFQKSTNPTPEFKLVYDIPLQTGKRIGTFLSEFTIPTSGTFYPGCYNNHSTISNPLRMLIGTFPAGGTTKIYKRSPRPGTEDISTGAFFNFDPATNVSIPEMLIYRTNTTPLPANTPVKTTVTCSALADTIIDLKDINDNKEKIQLMYDDNFTGTYAYLRPANTIISLGPANWLSLPQLLAGSTNENLTGLFSIQSSFSAGNITFNANGYIQFPDLAAYSVSFQANFHSNTNKRDLRVKFVEVDAAGAAVDLNEKFFTGMVRTQGSSDEGEHFAMSFIVVGARGIKLYWDNTTGSNLIYSINLPSMTIHKISPTYY